MSWLRQSFEWMSQRYTAWFADWLHVNFVIRTVILVLMAWLIIFVAALLFKYVLGPVAVLVYVNIFKRAWNFFVIETLQEWIYIRYKSRGSQQFSGLYYRLCDKIKRNRNTLSYAGYTGILERGRVRKVGNHLMVYSAVIAALWIGAFGLNQEYVRPAWVGAVDVSGDADENLHQSDDTNEDDGNDDEDNSEVVPQAAYIPGMLSPREFPAGGNVVLALAEEFRSDGVRLWDGPGPGTDTTVVEMLWGYDLLIYLGHYVPDSDVDALYWLRVRTPSGMEGYIGSQLVEVVG